MKTILDIAKVDAKDLSEKSVAVRSGVLTAEEGEKYFLRKRYRNLYRANILRTRGRSPSTRECDIALEEALEGEDHG